MTRTTAILILAHKRLANVSEILDILGETNIPIILSIDRNREVTLNEQKEHFSFVKSKKKNISVSFLGENLGSARHFEKVLQESFLKYDNLIVIEDDIIIPPIVIEEVNRLLQSRLPENIASVSLFPGLPGIISNFAGKNYWRISNYFCPWGFALQREDWSRFNLKITEKNIIEFYESKFYKRLRLGQRKVWRKRIMKVQSNPNYTYDTQIQILSASQNLLHLVPLFRASENIGFGDSEAVHTKGKAPVWFMGGISGKRFNPNKLVNFPISRVLLIWDEYTVGGDRKRFRLKN